MAWYMTNETFADEWACFHGFVRKAAFCDDFDNGRLREVDIAHAPGVVYLTALDADNAKYLFVVCIVRRDGGWGYKVMDANVGPLMESCPTHLLDWFEADNPSISAFGHAFIARNRAARALES